MKKLETTLTPLGESDPRQRRPDRLGRRGDGPGDATVGVTGAHHERAPQQRIADRPAWRIPGPGTLPAPRREESAYRRNDRSGARDREHDRNSETAPGQLVGSTANSRVVAFGKDDALRGRPGDGRRRARTSLTRPSWSSLLSTITRAARRYWA